MKYWSLFVVILFLPFLAITQVHDHSHGSKVLHAHEAEGKTHTKQPGLVVQPIQGPTPWTNLDLNNDSTHFQFAIISDRTGGHRAGVYMDAINKLNLLQPEFVVTVGDLIEGYTTDLDELNRQWDQFDGFVNKLQMPFFYLPGNHDISNEVMEHLWKKRLGPSYYHFVYKNILFLMMNSEEDTGEGFAKGNFSETQYQYVKKTLAENEDVDWTMVFFHQPVWKQKKATQWKAVEHLLKKRKHTVFAGHEHHYVKYRRNDSNYFILATTGGASGLRGPGLGEFDHVMWVTMTPEGPILANLLLDGIWDENIFTEDNKFFIERLEQNPPIQITPFFIQDSNFKEGEIILKITNDEDVPMKVKLNETFSEEIIGILSKRELTVNPNSVEKVKLILQRRGERFDKPMQVNATVAYEMEKTTIEIPYSFNIKPLKPYTLRKRKGRRKKIDGKSRDWKKLPFHYEAPYGDMKVDFDICYDDKYLYFAAKVQDDTVMTFGKGAVWSQDNVGFGISALPLAKSTMSTGTNWYTNELYQLISPSTDKVESVTYRPMPEGSEIKCVVTKTGYFMEAKMPISYIVEKQGKNWKTLRLIVVVDDKDGNQINRYWWKPTWMNPKINFIGSGTFFRP